MRLPECEPEALAELKTLVFNSFCAGVRPPDLLLLLHDFFCRHPQLPPAGAFAEQLFGVLVEVGTMGGDVHPCLFAHLDFLATEGKLLDMMTYVLNLSTYQDVLKPQVCIQFVAKVRMLLSLVG